MSWTDSEAGRRLRDQLADELAHRADPRCDDCTGSGLTPAGDVCGCVDW